MNFNYILLYYESSNHQKTGVPLVQNLFLVLKLLSQSVMEEHKENKTIRILTRCRWEGKEIM
jgi:hypothetical protein